MLTRSIPALVVALVLSLPGPIAVAVDGGVDLQIPGARRSAAPISREARSHDASIANLAECPVTPYAETGLDDGFTTTWYGDDDFRAGLDRSHEGRWYAGPASMKVQWRLPNGEPLSIEGHRRDATTPPLRADIPEGYSGGFQPSALTFPTEGCWEVVGRISSKELHFTVFVHPGQENPNVNPTAVPSSAVWDQLRRPVDGPTVAREGSCPRPDGGEVARVQGLTFGTGPLHVQGLSANGTVHLASAPAPDGDASITLRVIVSPDYTGPLLIRGHRLDEGGQIRFQASDHEDEAHLVIGETSTPDWWVTVLRDIRIPGAGCYTIEVTGLDVAETLVFEAIPDPT